MTTLRIVAAAIRHDDLVFSVPRPGRHHNVLHAIYARGLRESPIRESHEQGFLDSEGTFRTREEAAVIARDAGQLLDRAKRAAGLFSEDVW